jgi:ribosomal protein L11 methyltransferase
MLWTRVSIKTAAAGVEIATAVLIDAGITGMEIVDADGCARHLRETTAAWDYAEEELLCGGDGTARVIFYVAEGKEGAALLDVVRERLAGLDGFEVSTEGADDSEWKDEWKKHFKPLEVGRVVVVPQWESCAPQQGQVEFRIDPGNAFGTGQHATTRLCMLAMQNVSGLNGAAVLDIGCGSGILGIVSLLLGAARVTAVDIDPAGAIAATRANAALNDISAERIEVLAGDILTDAALRTRLGGGYGLVLANIVADVIIPLAPLAGGFLAEGGVFIASGIIDERAEDVRAALTAAGLRITEEMHSEGWACFAAERGHA